MQREKLGRVSDSLSKDFGCVVRSRREQLALSQEALAELAGIHRTYVSSVELGKVRLGLDIAKKVADALRTPLSELIAEAEVGGQTARRRRTRR